jgi:hypothetical protein
VSSLSRTWLRRIALGLPIVSLPITIVSAAGSLACACPGDRSIQFPVDERQAARVLAADGSYDLEGCREICREGPLPEDAGGIAGDAGPGPTAFELPANGCRLLPDADMLLLTCSFPTPCPSGRLPTGSAAPAWRASDAGAWLARMAWMEAASVPAFEELARDLARHGAPPRWIRSALRSADDERRHAARIGALARARGRDVAPVVREPGAPQSLRELALHNAVEGTVRETFGAWIAAWQAAHALDADVRGAMTDIARDEARHALLSEAIDRWAALRIDRGELDRARQRAAAELGRAGARAAHDDDTRLALGLPMPAVERALLAVALGTAPPRA